MTTSTRKTTRRTTTKAKPKKRMIEPSSEANLNLCPCCKSPAHVLEITHVTITCSRYGCRMVSAKTVEEAAKEWNKPDFREGKP